jgi:hypothetical protein
MVADYIDRQWSMPDPVAVDAVEQRTAKEDINQNDAN